MKKNLLFIIAAFITVISVNSLNAQSTPVPVSFGATLFGNYGYTVDGIEGSKYDKFDLERMYLTMKAQLGDQWKLQMTADVYRNTAAGTYYSGLGIRLKFGFLDYTPYSSLSIKAGMIPGPFNSVVESLWKYRGVAATANDKYGYVQTADLGVSVAYTLPSKYGEIAAYMFNGNGFTAPETNPSKDFVLRATINPFPEIKYLDKLKLGGYAYTGKTGAAGLKKERFGGLIGYSYSVVMVGAEYNTRTDKPDTKTGDVSGNVISFFTEIKAPVAELENKLSAILRYDSSDPNNSTEKDKTSFLVAGIVWKATDNVSLVIDKQLTKTDSPLLKTTAGPFTDRDDKWVINAIVNF